MIYTEVFFINGKSFTKTWSDTGYVMRDNISYKEANDPTELNRTYVEVPAPKEEDEADPDEVLEALGGVL